MRTTVTVVALASALFAVPPANADCTNVATVDGCNSAYCLSPSQVITAVDAWRMKQALGNRAVIVDIRAQAEVFHTGMPLGVDAHVPYMETTGDFRWNAAAEEPEMEIRFEFPFNVDEVIRAAQVGHDEPVILLGRTEAKAAMAAMLLQEHGYSRVYIVRDGYEGRLPWTAHVMPRWLPLEVQR